MISEAFAGKDSLVHRVDPRIRLVVVGLFALVVAAARDIGTAAAALALSCSLITMARLWGLALLKRLLLANGFILFLWVLLPFSTPGAAVAEWGPVTVTREGLFLSLLIALKGNAVILALIGLVATMPTATMGHALHRLKVSPKLCHLLLFVIRYIHVIEQEYLRLRRAMKTRAFRPRTNLHTYRSYGHLLGMLFVRSFDRAERVHQAMHCRGFRGRFYSLTEFSLTPRDVFFGLAGILLTATLVVFELWRRSSHV